MINKNVFSWDVGWNFKSVSLFLFLLALPNLLSVINISTPWGFKIHFFQLAIFIAAAIYGPRGGLLSGLLGSLYSGILMNNPYLVVGNALLGFLVGFFVRYKIHTLIAVLSAFIIQLPWLILTDHYLVHLPVNFIVPLVIALLISNTLWAIIAHFSTKPIKSLIQC